jgi:hypothetical protein
MTEDYTSFPDALQAGSFNRPLVHTALEKVETNLLLIKALIKLNLGIVQRISFANLLSSSLGWICSRVPAGGELGNDGIVYGVDMLSRQ